MTVFFQTKLDSQFNSNIFRVSFLSLTVVTSIIPRLHRVDRLPPSADYFALPKEAQSMLYLNRVVCRFHQKHQVDIGSDMLKLVKSTVAAEGDRVVWKWLHPVNLCLLGLSREWKDIVQLVN